MTRLSDLTVQRFRTKRVPNPYAGQMTWRLYQKARNAIVRTCRRHGPVGPFGVFPLRSGRDISDWERGDDNPVYWIVDDQYNDEAYLYMEFVDPLGFTNKWLEGITKTLTRLSGWGIGVNSLRQGYVLIFADRLLVKGPQFRGCRNAESIVEAIRSEKRTTRSK